VSFECAVLRGTDGVEDNARRVAEMVLGLVRERGEENEAD